MIKYYNYINSWVNTAFTPLMTIREIEARNIFVKRMQWYGYWDICEYSVASNLWKLIRSPKRRSWKTGGSQTPSIFYHSKLYCFLYCLFVLFLFLNSVFTFISESIIHWTCYCIGSAELRHTKDGCMSCILTSIKISQKNRMGYVELAE